MDQSEEKTPQNPLESEPIGKLIFKYSIPAIRRICTLGVAAGANQLAVTAVQIVMYTPEYQDLYALRKQTMERVFADANEKHAIRYTQYRGLARVSKWVRLKFAAMNLKKLALWRWSGLTPAQTLLLFFRSFFLIDQNRAYAAA